MPTLAEARPGTEAEEAAYALREAESPEAGEFVGGDLGAVATFSAITFVVLLLLALFISNVESEK